MSLSSDNMMKLMAFADGELESSDREAVMQLIATNDDAVRFVEQVGGIGDYVKVIDGARDGKTVAAFDVADQVMGAIAEETPAPKLAPVASLADARKKKGNGRVVGVAFVTALALAASVFFLARPKEAALSGGPVAQAAHVERAEKASPAAPVDPAEPNIGVEVEKPGSSVSVFYLPGQNEVSTSVVVWVDETAEK